jgi:DNA-binding NarL/FixJ family response regulator
MAIAISGAGGTAAAAAIQAQATAAAPPPSTTSATAAEDKVTISAAAQEVPQPMSMQVLALHKEGQSVPQIATQLAISPTAVQSYLGAQAAAQK